MLPLSLAKGTTGAAEEVTVRAGVQAGGGVRFAF